MSRSVGAEIELQYSGFFNYRFALVMGTGRIHSEGRGQRRIHISYLGVSLTKQG